MPEIEIKDRRRGIGPHWDRKSAFSPPCWRCFWRWCPSGLTGRTPRPSSSGPRPTISGRFINPTASSFTVWSWASILMNVLGRDKPGGGADPGPLRKPRQKKYETESKEVKDEATKKEQETRPYRKSGPPLRSGRGDARNRRSAGVALFHFPQKVVPRDQPGVWSSGDRYRGVRRVFIAGETHSERASDADTPARTYPTKNLSPSPDASARSRIPDCANASSARSIASCKASGV